MAIDGSLSRDARPDTDVERGSIEYRLHERERFLRTLIANLPGVVYRCRTDEQWTTEFVSAGVRFVGYAPEDFVGTRRVSWTDIMHRDDREQVRTAIRDLVDSNLPFTTATHVVSYRLVAASGELKDVRDSFRFVYDERGAPVALEGVITTSPS